MLLKKFLYISLFFVLLITACQDSSQNNSLPDNNSSKTTSTSPNPNPSPQNTLSQTNTPVTNSQTILKQEEIKIGATLPEITTKDVTAKTTVIASRTDKTGQLIMVYAPTCPICHETMPNVVNLYKSFFQRNNIPIIALSVQPQAVTELSVKELSIPFSVVVMPEVDQKFGYKVPSIPTLIAIGPDGIIRGIWVGQIGADQMTQIIKIFCPTCDIEISRS
ncbi:MAG: TlpA family protein disulfide reductase [Acidobacteria bacterium]|nr:TlpA family protein disulfide reductase [Acidobacteriota bacterium]